MYRTQFSFSVSVVAPTLLASSLLLLSSCVAPYSTEELEIVDTAFATGDTSQLRGRTKYLYQRKARQLRVEHAAENLDPSGLDFHDLRLYEKEVAKIDRAEREAELENRRIVEALERERLIDLEEKRVADAAATRKAEREAAAKAARLAREKEEKRLQAIADAKEFKAKIAEPLHAEWDNDIDMLKEHFHSNDFQPADRLASVYARTVQLLVNGSANPEQVSEFYAELSEPEQADYTRLFNDKTGVELVAGFWAKHERNDAIPALD